MVDDKTNVSETQNIYDEKCGNAYTEESMQLVKTKICPMRPTILEDVENGTVSFYKCEREECAWWNIHTNSCAVLAIPGLIQKLK